MIKFCWHCGRKLEGNNERLYKRTKGKASSVQDRLYHKDVLHIKPLDTLGKAIFKQSEQEGWP